MWCAADAILSSLKATAKLTGLFNSEVLNVSETADVQDINRDTKDQVALQPH